ncbi:hypothetical protein EDC02_4922 [Micromonospora sp. Llam0]|nr:hypothetical protein EDC02_4922 [Micromonospora sp. Llam0]
MSKKPAVFALLGVAVALAYAVPAIAAMSSDGPVNEPKPSVTVPASAEPLVSPVPREDVPRGRRCLPFRYLRSRLRLRRRQAPPSSPATSRVGEPKRPDPSQVPLILRRSAAVDERFA